MAISAPGGGSNHADSANTNTITMPFNISSGDTIVLSVCIYSDTVTILSVTWPYGNSGVSYGTAKNSTASPATLIDLWSTPASGGLAGSGGNIVVNLSGACAATATAEIYQGVVALGNTTTTTNTNADPSISLTMQDTNNWIVGGFAALATVNYTDHATGVYRDGVNLGNATVGISDNTQAGTGSLATRVTMIATDWAAAALELRTVAGGSSAIPGTATTGLTGTGSVLGTGITPGTMISGT